MGQPDLLSIADVAKLSGLSAGTIRREIADGHLRSCKKRRRRLIRREDYEAWLARNDQPAVSKAAAGRGKARGAEAARVSATAYPWDITPTAERS